MGMTIELNRAAVENALRGVPACEALLPDGRMSDRRIAWRQHGTLRRAFPTVGWMLPLLLALGCDFPGKPDPKDRPAPEGQITDFGRLFTRHCAGCHGAEGKLGPAPPLNDPIFLAIAPDEELRRTIAAGRRGTPMPAFAHHHGGPLSDDQVQALAGGLKRRWKAKEPASGAPPPYLANPDEAGDAARGRAVFARACADCHGERGEGGDMAGAIASPEFLQLISDQALRRIVITGRPDLGMPSHSNQDRDADFESLSSRDVSDLVALLAEWRRRGGSSAAADSPNAGAESESSQE
jgi:mono/diheme cytochrome c family protein